MFCRDSRLAREQESLRVGKREGVVDRSGWEAVGAGKPQVG